MVDYVPVLARAVEALNPNTREARRALYDRARRALGDSLRASDPTLSDTDLRTQSAALEAAIHRVEAEAVRRAAPPPPPPPPEPAYETDEPPAEAYQDQPPLQHRRRPWGIIAGVAGALVILLAGIAAYSLWPRKPTATRPLVASRTAAQQPAGGTGYVYLRQPVYFRTNHPEGTIVVDRAQSFLYVVRPSVTALRYGIGVGPECQTTGPGLYQVARKEEWPGWKPPAKPSAEAAGDQIKNPLGARALHLNRDYRIHGTNAPNTIGQRVSQGCIRLTNEDVIHLYDRAPLETRVVVLN